MSVILFFGYSLFVLLAGFMLMGLSIYNIYKKSEEKKLLAAKSPAQESLNESATLEKSQS